MKNHLYCALRAMLSKSAFSAVALCLFSWPSVANLTLQEAIHAAIDQDLWLSRSQLEEQAMQWQGTSANTLPNPVLSVSMLNLPTSGFDPNQEDMTQLKLGISQALPRGDSLTLRQTQHTLKAAEQPHLRANRKEQVRVQVTRQWLAAYQARLSHELMHRHRHLFVELLALSEARYQSTQGPTRLQDMVQAKVEIARIDDKLNALESDFNEAWAALAEWLGEHPKYSKNTDDFVANLMGVPTLSEPVISALAHHDLTQLAAFTKNHPTLQAMAQMVKSSAVSVQLAEQAYKPKWGVNASYAYRDDRENNTSRADFFSVGITVDMPLFDTTRQDADVSVAKLRTEATRTEQRLQHKQLMAKALSAHERLQQLTQREARYNDSILPQLHHRSEAAIASYRHANGIFDVAVQAHIDHLQAQVELIKLRTQRIQAQSELAYYFSDSRSQHAPQGGRP